MLFKKPNSQSGFQVLPKYFAWWRFRNCIHKKYLLYSLIKDHLKVEKEKSTQENSNILIITKCTLLVRVSYTIRMKFKYNCFSLCLFSNSPCSYWSYEKYSRGLKENDSTSNTMGKHLLISPDIYTLIILKQNIWLDTLGLQRSTLRIFFFPT